MATTPAIPPWQFISWVVRYGCCRRFPLTRPDNWSLFAFPKALDTAALAADRYEVDLPEVQAALAGLEQAYDSYFKLAAQVKTR